MKSMHLTVAVWGLLLASLAGQLAWADVFSMPSGQTSLQFVTVGDPGNALDTRWVGYPKYQLPIGTVNYTYQMGKYDVTAAQYCQFLNAVASVSDPYGLYNMYMAPDKNNGSHTFGINQSGGSGSYTYSVTGNPNFPMNQVTWGDAARFANWLSNGQPTGVQGAGTTETGSYTLNGAMSGAALLAITRNPGAKYALPTEDEWYKAAYYKGGSKNAGYWLYPTKSDSVPSNILSSTGTNNANYCSGSGYTDPVNYLTAVGYFAGSPGPYGTFDMGGDVWQLNDAVISASYRGERGGSCMGNSSFMQASWTAGSLATDHSETGGFRVVQVPEPMTLAVLALGSVLIFRRRRA